VIAPVLRLVRLSTTPLAGVPTVVSWSLAGTLRGLRRYDLQVRQDGGAYRALALATPWATTRALTLLGGHTYTFRVRAVDSAGRIGAWQTVGPRRGQNLSDGAAAIRWTGDWSPVRLRTYLGGQAHWSGTAGATASLGFSGTNVAWVGPVGPTRGRAQVYLDGRLVTTVDLWAASFSPRRIVFAASVRDGPHTLTIKALGTAGRPTVAIDAIYVVAPR
jgi:hypothetical protein